MTINFQTDVGGDMKINFWITDPAHRSVNMQNHATMGEFSFDAHRDGQYTYCFLNVRRLLSRTWARNQTSPPLCSTGC